MKRTALFNALLSVAAIALIVIVWVVACFFVRNDYVLPSVGEVVSQMGRIVCDASFWRSFANTLLRTFWAFLISMGAGVVMAVCAHRLRWLRVFFAPIISVVRTVPTMAVILMLLLWTTPAVTPVIVSALVLFPAAYAAVLAALDEVAEGYGELTRAFRVGFWRRLGKMYLPLSAPVVLKQAGGIFSLGLKVVISGEVLASTYRSLGAMMQQAQIFLEMSRLMALTVLVIVAGFLLEGACALFYRIIVWWRRETH